jgi:predicted transcriptional regulator
MSGIEEKWEAIESFLFEVLRKPDRYPDRLAVFALEDEELHKIFSRERLRLLKALKEREFGSVVELSEYLGRDKGAVDRDLKILEEYGLVKRVREGKKVRPVIDKEGIYLPLTKPKPVEELVA